MRIVLVAFLLTAAPAVAQQGAFKPEATETYRTRSVEVFGSDACPTSTNPEEIVVCRRRPEEERYRLPNPTPDPGDRTETGGNQRLGAAMDLDQAGGTGTCSTVGPGGSQGCFTRNATRNRQTERQNRATENPETPESIAGPR